MLPREKGMDESRSDNIRIIRRRDNSMRSISGSDNSLKNDSVKIVCIAFACNALKGKLVSVGTDATESTPYIEYPFMKYIYVKLKQRDRPFKRLSPLSDSKAMMSSRVGCQGGDSAQHRGAEYYLDSYSVDSMLRFRKKVTISRTVA